MDEVLQLAMKLPDEEHLQLAEALWARELPADMRHDLLRFSEDGDPAGYEELLKSYYKAISTGQK